MAGLARRGGLNRPGSVPQKAHSLERGTGYIPVNKYLLMKEVVRHAVTKIVFLFSL